tara:strand:+ start:2777 stop:2992 length:216 start_codon:yes stop_codon:yes gene_type:complete
MTAEKKIKSNKTTIAGVTAAVAIFANEINKALSETEAEVNWLMVLMGAGMAAMAVFSRDDNVSDQGTKVAK